MLFGRTDVTGRMDNGPMDSGRLGGNGQINYADKNLILFFEMGPGNRKEKTIKTEWKLKK